MNPLLDDDDAGYPVGEGFYQHDYKFSDIIGPLTERGEVLTVELISDTSRTMLSALIGTTISKGRIIAVNFPLGEKQVKGQTIGIAVHPVPIPLFAASKIVTGLWRVSDKLIVKFIQGDYWVYRCITDKIFRDLAAEGQKLDGKIGEIIWSIKKQPDAFPAEKLSNDSAISLGLTAKFGSEFGGE